MPLKWRSTGQSELDAHVQAVAASWEGTRYMAGQKAKGSHADCVRYMAGMIDDLCGYDRPTPRRLPQDMALTDPAKAREAMKFMLSLYPEWEKLQFAEEGKTDVNPGDAIIVGHENGGPGHCIFVGGERGMLWHCVQLAGVTPTGMVFTGAFQRYEVKAVYRSKERDQWLSTSR